MTPQCTPPTNGRGGWADGDAYGDGPYPGSLFGAASPSRNRIAGPYDRLAPTEPGDAATPQLVPAPAPVQRPSWYQRLKAAAKALKHEVLAVYYAMSHPQTPWLAKAIGFLVLAYALSPLDLIPDFIPVLGILDDVILLPLMIAAAIALIPRDVMESSRRRAADEPLRLGRNWPLAAIIAAGWLAAVEWLAYWLVTRYGSTEVQSYLPYGMAAMGVAAVVGFVVWLVRRVRTERKKQRKAAAKAAAAAKKAAAASAVAAAAAGAAAAAAGPVDVETGPQTGTAQPEDAGLRQPLLSGADHECVDGGGEGEGEGGSRGDGLV